MQQPEYSVDPTAAEEFIAGVVDGLIHKDDLPELKKCFEQVPVVLTSVKKIANEISKGDMPDILKGVTDAIALVQQLPTDLADCKDIQGDLKKIETWGQGIISDPTKIAQNVMANWSAIQADVKTVNDDMQTSKYEDAGEKTADIVVLALGKINYAELDKDIDWDLVNAHNPIY